MKLLFLNSIDRATYGGMEEWIRLVASGLRKRGHGITVAGRQDSAFLRRLGASDSQLELLPLKISGDFNPATISAIHSAIEQRRIDAVLVNFNKDLRLGGLAARWSGDARIIWSIGLDITRDSIVHRWLTPKLADAIIVPSESLKRQITRHGYLETDVIEVIPIGIPDTSALSGNAEVRARIRSAVGLPEDAIIAVTSGRFVEQKGHRFLLEAISALAERISSLYFLWLGSGPLENELRIRVDELGLTSRVIFAGMLDSVDEHLAASDLMIHPSIEEPFGIAILEGMRAGLPVVASDVGGIPEVVDNRCAQLVPPRDSTALVEAVAGLASNAQSRLRMGMHARERFLSEFSVETMFDRIERCVSGVVHGERRAG
ncbi:hypothetical protein C3F09_01830 [candidate division GN15 bacterium]|uniref:Glycosyltransferase family 1 protein n=1 Tax=candidate division GN15 bacterium TaxID=2072418 RepID=A0A855XAZ1_9BACT|nr:MAG: hypothetical protein C3F09_01830 [candidate division GN15 bacterium]